LEPFELSGDCRLRAPQSGVIEVRRQVLPSSAVVPDVNQVMVSWKMLRAPVDEVGQNLGIAGVHAWHVLKPGQPVLHDPVTSGSLSLCVELNEQIQMVGGADLLHLLKVVGTRAFEIVVASHEDKPRPVSFRHRSPPAPMDKARAPSQGWLSPSFVLTQSNMASILSANKAARERERTTSTMLNWSCAERLKLKLPVTVQ